MNHDLYVNKVMDCIIKSSLQKSCKLALKQEEITHGEDLERISVYHLELYSLHSHIFYVFSFSFILLT